MDKFDSYLKKGEIDSVDLDGYLKNEKERSVAPVNNELLTEKREEVYKFFTSTKTVIIVCILWLGFLFTLYNSLVTFSASAGGVGLKIILLVINVVIGITIPISFYKLYFGSKSKNPSTVKSGFEWLIIFFKIIKAIIIIFAVYVGLKTLLNLTFVTLLVTMIFIGLPVWLFLHMVSVFNDFLEELSYSFHNIKAYVPSTNKIFTWLVVFLILNILSALILITVYENLAANIPSHFENQVKPLLEQFEETKTFRYIGISIGVVIRFYFLYYLSSFDKTFEKFNWRFKKRISDAD